MGAPSVPWQTLARWYFRRRAEIGSWVYRATCSLDDLARVYIEEGQAEGVRGDLAFAQAVLETGWFSWPYPPDHPSPVLPEYNNFAGIGATDDPNDRTPNRFATCREGVRAHMQHLRAYATTEGGCDLHGPCLDPRFRLVRRGTGERILQFGNGVWASSPNNYGGRILDRFREILAYRD